MKTTKFYLIPVNEDNEMELCIWLNERNYTYCLPTCLLGNVLREFNEKTYIKPLGIILRDHMIKPSVAGR